MEPNSQQTRNRAVNLIKAVSVIAIFLIHCRFPGTAGKVIRGLASFGVPVFFMISGCYSYGASRDKIKKRSLHVLRLIFYANLFYLLWDIAFLAVQGKNAGAWLRECFTVKRLLVFLLFNETPLRGHLWFLGALLYSYICMWAVIRLKEKRWWRDGFLYAVTALPLAGNLALGEALTAMGHNIQIPYVRNWLFSGIPCFFIGYLIRRRKEEGRGPSVSVSLLRVLLPVSVLAGIAEVSFIPASELYVSTIVIAVVGFLLAVNGSYDKAGRFLTFIDRNSGTIYILQVAVIKSIQLAEARLGIEQISAVRWLTPAAAFAATCLVSAAFRYIMRSIKPAG